MVLTVKLKFYFYQTSVKVQSIYFLYCWTGCSVRIQVISPTGEYNVFRVKISNSWFRMVMHTFHLGQIRRQTFKVPDGLVLVLVKDRLISLPCCLQV